MVKLGFIVEGDSEAILIKDDSFQNMLLEFNLNSCKQLVINAGGKNNLYNPKGDFTFISIKVHAWVKSLLDKGAEKIIFLLDFDNEEECFTLFKSKIFSFPENIIVIAKQALEAWYLADSVALKEYLLIDNEIFIDLPESYLKPIDEIKRLRLEYCNKGISDKKSLTKNFIKSGFTLKNASKNIHCLSAQYFIKKLKEIND